MHSPHAVSLNRTRSDLFQCGLCSVFCVLCSVWSALDHLWRFVHYSIILYHLNGVETDLRQINMWIYQSVLLWELYVNHWNFKILQFWNKGFTSILCLQFCLPFLKNVSIFLINEFLYMKCTKQMTLCSLIVSGLLQYIQLSIY